MTWSCQVEVETAKLGGVMTDKKTESTKSYDTIKLGIDAHGKWYDAARQLDGATPQPVQKMDLWRLYTGQTTAEKLGPIYLPDAT